MFGRTARFFSGYIFRGANKTRVAAATLMDFAIFLVNNLPIVLIARHEDSQRTGTPEHLYIGFSVSLVMGQVLPRLRNLLLDSVAVNVQTELSSSMHQECFSRPMERHLGTRVGELSKALFSNYMSVEKIVPTLFGEALPTFINTAGVTAVIGIRYPSYSWAMAIPPGLFVLNLGIATFSAKKSLATRKAFLGVKHEFFGAAMESVGNYTIAHQFGNVPYEVSKVRTILDKGEPINLRARRIDTLTGLSHSLLNYAGLIAFFVKMTELYSSQRTTEYDAAAVGYLMAYLSRNLDALGPAFSELTIAYEDAKDITDFHRSRPTPALPALELDMAPSIRFERVNFSYEAKDAKGNVVLTPILRDFNLEMKPRETVAIIGKSGIGKSTILNLLLGFYRPSSGTIFINDVDISTVSPTSLRDNIAVVSQDANLFNSTVSGNIKYGKMDAKDEEVKELAKLAGLTATEVEVKNKPKAEAKSEVAVTVAVEEKKEPDPVDKMLATQTGDKGSKISGGERQRVAFARACLRGGVVLLADEPTSALDAKAEEQLLENLFKIKHGATTILITHKLYTLTQVDRICVVEEGRVVEEGTFSELLAKRGQFYNLLEAQCRELGIDMSTVTPRARVVADGGSVLRSGFSITQSWANRREAESGQKVVNTRTEGPDSPLLVMRRRTAAT
jgi:ATP-binding cassette, subfamily B, heavy metal transporter